MPRGGAAQEGESAELGGRLDVGDEEGVAASPGRTPGCVVERGHETRAVG